MIISDLFFSLLRYDLYGDELSSEILDSITEETIKELELFSTKHECAHFLFSPLVKCGKLSVDDELYNELKSIQMKTVYNVSNIDYEFKRLKSAFNKIKVEFVPLKGSVIRDYYPEKWMRNSCDIDILIHSSDLDKACEYLVNSFGYVIQSGKKYHDISLMSPNGINLELHFSIMGDLENIDNLLSKAWDYAKRENDDSFEIQFTNEFFMFHIIAHMYYHFYRGGCGIRPLIDLYFLYNKLELDNDVLYKMLEYCGLIHFYQYALKLSKCWMQGEPFDDVTALMSEYIISGGVYGSFKNLIKVNRNVKKSKIYYFFSRVFMPLKQMKMKYPTLDKLPFLLPFYYVVRILNVLFNHKTSKSFYEYKITSSIDDEENALFSYMMDELGINNNHLPN